MERPFPIFQSLCVFCGSREGTNPSYQDAAERLGVLLAENGVHMVYGGGSIGLMGIAADAALAAGGEVTGVIPDFLLQYEVEHEGLTDLVIVDTMHERKRIMYDKSDGFIILPGGLGTLDECMEVITWKQLRQHDKPIVVVDVGGYWTSLMATVDHAVEEGFVSPANRNLFRVVSDVSEVFDGLAQQGPELTEDHSERF